MTRQRKLIIDVINNSCHHLTADDIYAEAKKTMPSIALGTVYRNLGILVSDGTIGKVERSGLPDFYDKSSVSHGHMICEKCGKILDIDWPEIKTAIEARAGVNITEFELKANYICNECKKN